VSFTAAGQSATFSYDETNDTWYQVGKAGPTMIDSGDIVAGSIDTAHIAADNITSALIADDQVDSEHIAAGAVDLEHMSANSIDSDQYVDGSIDAVHLASGYRAVSDGAALTLAATDRNLQITNTASGAVAATMTATHAGHEVNLRMIAGDGANYYTLAVNGGTITLNSANEACSVVYDGAAWQLQALMGATFA
jgi:hypothetical protein